MSARGKFAYGAFFLIVVPAGLVLWAKSTAKLIAVPSIHSPTVGGTLVMCGLLLMIAGMRDLLRKGGGLPMNAAPPPRLVRSGAYALLPHPIYAGFSLMCGGAAIWSGSGSGLLLVTPTVALACAALVLGYEHHDLRERFGELQGGVLPADVLERPSWAERARCFLLATLPWDVGAGMLAAHASGGLARYGVVVVVMFSVYPVAARTRRGLRRYSVECFAAIAVAWVLFLGLPLVTPQGGALHALDFVASPVVVCALILEEAAARAYRALRWVFRMAAVCAVVYAVSAGWVSGVSALAATAAVMAAVNLRRLWDAARWSSERIANSWREWRIGRARFIYHGLWAGAGGLLAVWLGASLAGPDHLAALVFAGSCAVIGAALWAQYVEGSAELLRPFGFYGGLIGGTLGSLAAPMFHTNPWLILAVIAAGGLWAQALGRLRCLVQGCCHGRPCADWLGIRYLEPKSRVCRFTPWRDVSLHPTPLYSVLWNGVGGLLLLRLWTVHAALALVIGVYFILSGLGRFAEEAWRGEPQTEIVWGLRLYQWAAVGSVLLGMVFTAIAPVDPAPEPKIAWSALYAALVFGVIVSCAMGLDFPESNRRFSRLV